MMRRIVGDRPGRGRAFTLIEILVVVAIIALLIAILMPSLTLARARAQAVMCQSNLRQIGLGLVMYSQANHDYAVPSYNLPWALGATTNYSGGPDQPLDGWAPILDRDKVVPTNRQDTNTTFYCPNTVDIEGMAAGQTADNVDKPKGWTDWPLRFTLPGGDSSPKEATLIPERHFNKIIRVSYWINAYNPVSDKKPSNMPAADLHYTNSVGLGPDVQGNFLKPHKMRLFKPSPCLFIVVSDGLYMGRQSVTRQGDENSRIGYRHPGFRAPYASANIILADGHVEAMSGDRFPRALGSKDSDEVKAAKKHENCSGPTIYANPQEVFR